MRLPQQSENIVRGLVALVPTALYIATASSSGYWLDAGEFIAQASCLGISHPPGHPAMGLLGSLAHLLPIGPFAFRVALLSAVAAGAASVAIYLAYDHTLVSIGVRHRSVRRPIAIASTMLVVLGTGFWFQAVRPEVYALQGLLIAITLERALAFFVRGSDNPKPLFVAVFASGLSLANHHFLGILCLPILALATALAIRRHGKRLAFSFAGLFIAGLSPYIYLPVRALRDASLNLGDPSTPANFWWVVSAETFQGTSALSRDSIFVSLYDVCFLLAESLHPVSVALALGGAYLLLRGKASRPVGVFWAVVLLLFVVARAWLGFVKSNPDALGYLIPAMIALGAMVSALVGQIAAKLAGSRPEPKRWALVLVPLVLIWPAWLLPDRAAASTLARFSATDALSDFGRRVLPPRALVFVHNPQTAFRYWGAEATEQLRPDVMLVPIPLLHYPSMVSDLIEEAPELRDLLREYRLRGRLDKAELQSLAGVRPVFIEMDVRVPMDLYRSVSPGVVFYEVLGDELATAEERAEARDATEDWRALYARLGPDSTERETRLQLLWRHYVDALYFAGVGDRESAVASIKRGLRLVPEGGARELRALGAKIGREGLTRPLDITPFLPQSGAPSAN